MTSELLGVFERELDDKGRITIPAAWRPQLAEPFFVCPGVNGKCLFILPKWRWDEVREKLSRVTYNNRQGMALQRLFALGSETRLDGQGRVMISPMLRERVSIKEQAILCGGFDRIEIWNPEERRQFEQEQLSPEAVDEAVGSLQL